METAFLVVLPLYNHGSAVVEVIRGILALPPETLRTAMALSDALPMSMLVVDDGSTDGGPELVEHEIQRLDAEEPPAFLRLSLLRHTTNLGKGAALLSAAAWAEECGFTHMVTMDADGQHPPAELPKLLAASRASSRSIIVGARDFSVPHVPGASRFGRSFSGFWMRVQTGQKAPDMQSGYRVYPVAVVRALTMREKRFAFEMEVLVKAAWAGFSIVSVPVRVYYPPQAERVSHFRKGYDNLLITLMNTRLTIRALIPLPFQQREYDHGAVSVLHPLASLRRLLAASATPRTLAFSTFAALLINMLPLIGVQSVITLLAIGRFGLNRMWTLALHHAVWPPLVIPLCVEAGHFLRTGTWLTEISWTTIGREAPMRIWEWILGGIIAAPVVAAVCGLAVYLAAKRIRHTMRNNSNDRFTAS